MDFALGFGGGGAFGRSGSAPSPFDALNGSRLAGHQGSHPLHEVRAADLLRESDGALAGAITINGRARVGEPIRGQIELTALKPINARRANLRLIGLRLQEEQKSHTRRQGDTTHTEHWVEANGRLFEELPFLEPPIPTTLAEGQQVNVAFAIPAPALGPPSAHLGEAIVAWAIEVRFDIPMAGDAFLATYLPLAQHPDLIGAGVGEQGGQAMLASLDVDGGTISVESDLPAMAGTVLRIRASWPSAPGGPARIELHRRSNAPNGVQAMIATSDLTGEALASGGATVDLPLPDDLAPSFDGAGLQLDYLVRVLVNRRFRPDSAIERPISIA